MTTSTLTPAAGLAQGESRRDAALMLLRVHRAALVRRLQRAYLALLLDRGPVVRANVLTLDLAFNPQLTLF